MTSARTALTGDRLGIYIDTVHRVFDTPEGPRIATDPADFAFVGIFLPTVGAGFSSLLLFGRTDPGELGEYVPLPPEVELVELPHYGDLRQLPSVARALFGTANRFWKGLEQVDTVWIFGPHPFGLMLAGMAALRRRQIVLGVRQDTMAYFRSRLPSQRWKPLLVGAHALDIASIALPAGQDDRDGACDRQTLRRPSPGFRHVGVRRAFRGRGDRPSRSELGRPIELITVGRLDPEKNPLLLVEAIGELDREEPGRYSVTWIGGGPMEEAIRERTAELGVTDRINLIGFVPFGPELLDLYRRAHAFVHVSMTEGVPKVLVEALGCATPIVATDVGGVRDVLDDGRAGLLIPPADLPALVAAIRRMSSDAALRERLVLRGLELAQELTLETQSQRVAGFIAGEIDKERN